MLAAIRFVVRVTAVFVLPAGILLLGYLTSPVLKLDRGELSALFGFSLFVLPVASVLETRVFYWELRSLFPRPGRAAVEFLFRLGLTLLLTDVSFLLGLLSRDRFLYVLSLPASLLAYVIASSLLLSPSDRLVRGRKYRTFREVILLSKLEDLSARGPKLFWGGVHLPWSSAVKHFLVMGCTGAGKTMVLDLLLKSALPGRIGKGFDERGILYDNKTECVPLLSALGVPFKILHPFDRRGVALHLAAMVPTHTHSLEIAAILMPQATNVGTDPFWVDAPRNLLASVLTSLRIGVPVEGGKPRPCDFDFRDVVWTMERQELIREVISRHEETRSGIEGYFDDPRLLANVMASVKTQMMYYKPVAACWHVAPERINLTDAAWGEEEYLLVLGNDEEFRRAINPINRVIVTRYGQLALKRPRSSTRRIWFFLDEFPALKRLDPELMEGLLTRGRSKGVAMVLGIQTLHSVINEYGREVGKTILSQCGNAAILALGDLDDETAQFAAHVVGQVERYERGERSESKGLSSRRTMSERLTSRPVLLPSEFTDLPETARRNGLAGYYRTRSRRGFWGALLPGAFLDRALPRPDPAVPAIEERDLRDHDLTPWDADDWNRLGLTPDVGAVSPEAQLPQPPGRKVFRVVRGGKSRPADAA